MSLRKASSYNFRNEWAKSHLTQRIQQQAQKLRDKPKGVKDFPLKQDHLLKLPYHEKSSEPIKVGIIGAGAAGMFTAMIFDYLNENIEGFKVSYDILEAAKREGGRLYTHHFSNEKLDYFDVGAMRFPENPIMERVFQLFQKLGMEKSENLTPKTAVGSLVPYYMQNDAGEPWCFNNVTKWGRFEDISSGAEDRDPFNANSEGTIQPSILQSSPDKVIKESVKCLIECLQNDGKMDKQDGWKTMLEEYDMMSTREYLRHETEKVRESGGNVDLPQYNADTIEWLEMFNGGTNSYDQSHSETVLESLDFDYEEGTKWWCVLGGSQQIAKRMESSLSSKPEYNSRVNAIRKLGEDQMQVDIQASSKTASRTYSAVFSSVPLGCLQHIDTAKAGLNSGTRQAIRSLGYGASAKVGMKFKHAWWLHDLGDNNMKGGLGHSDLMIRTCVYPSYNHDVPPNTPAVLLCSYTWQQDAQRLAALFGDRIQSIQERLIEQERQLGFLQTTYGTERKLKVKQHELESRARNEKSKALRANKELDIVNQTLISIIRLKKERSRLQRELKSLKATEEDELKEQIFRDLARLHQGQLEEEKLYHHIKDLYMDHYAFDWYRNHNSMGAFALFRPQQFSGMWNRITCPSQNLVIIGEAASPHHAWVVGSLESAVHGVYSWLAINKYRIPTAKKAMERLENEEDENPFVGLPGYLNAEIAQAQAVVAEKVRLQKASQVSKL